uniref:Uncharacterized protein n=1 Tax=Salvator merianae TaxID=96440 RepID=A0A8D0EDZ1_SALMN
MEIKRLLFLLAVFLLHMKLSQMSPVGLVCDGRLIQKYITEARDLENKASHCEELPLLQHPVHLPLVGFSLQEWRRKANQGKRQEVLQDLSELVNATAMVQEEFPEGCTFGLLQQLFERASFLLLYLQNFVGQELDAAWQQKGACQLIQERHVRTVFQTYKQLVQGKLRFLFLDLQKGTCGEQGDRLAAAEVQHPPSPAASGGQ